MISLLLAAVLGSAGPRLELSLNPAWRFVREDRPEYSQQAFDDRKWELVNAPHSARLDPLNASGGENWQGVCWYRRHLSIDRNWFGRKIYIRFGGAQQVADVWVNDHHVATHYGGYLPFQVDVSNLVKPDTDNLVAVRLDNRDQPLVPPGKPQSQLDFSYFGGLTRDVSMIVEDNLHVTDPIDSQTVAGGGVYVTYPSISPERAEVRVKAEVANESSSSRHCRITNDILDAEGKRVSTATSDDTELGAGALNQSEVSLTVAQPHLWHPNHPYLYRLVTTVWDGGRAVDQTETNIGLRTIRFQPDGLYINGEPFFSIGFNHHQDGLYVGYAMPDRLEAQDVRKLREAGMTSFRSHYPHSQAFMDECDRLGVLTIISTPGWQYFTNNPLFLSRSYEDTREMVKLFRNDPSVILWEIGLNESGYSEQYGRTAYKIVHSELPGEGVYCSGDARMQWQQKDPVFDVLYNDGGKRVAPNPLWWREFGDYQDMNWGDQISSNRITRDQGEAAMLLQASIHFDSLRSVVDSDPKVIGCGLWAGIDCDRGGHPLPFVGGLIDKARLPKFDFYMFKSQQSPDVHVADLQDGPFVFIANQMLRYSSRDVTVYSNCESVNLYRDEGDGKWIPVGIQPVPVLVDGLRQPAVFKAAYGLDDGRRLKAEATIGGKVVATQTIGAPGMPVKLVLRFDDAGRKLVADGSDIVRVYATMEDGAGNTVPFADRSIRFTVSGPGFIVGGPEIEANPVRSEAGIATALIRAGRRAGRIVVTATAQNMAGGSAEITTDPEKQPAVAGRDMKD